MPSQEDNANELTRASETGSEGASFWTACPYCYVMYEYPKVYVDCTLRCQSCRRGFHAVVVRSPPKDGFGSFSSWGFFPVGFSGDFRDISGSSSKWNPFSPLIPCAFKGEVRQSGKHRKGPYVFYDDDASAEFAEGSDTTKDDSDDDDWHGGNQKGMAKKRTGKRGRKRRNGNGGDVRREPIERPRRGVHSHTGGDEGNVNGNVESGEVADGDGDGVAAAAADSGKKGALGGSRRRSERNVGKLDLNVEFSNEVEESLHEVDEGNENGNAEDNIEGIGFFEGLDEFLSSLPILNAVADDKVKGH